MREFFFVLVLALCLYSAPSSYAAPPDYTTKPRIEIIAVLWIDGDRLKAINLIITDPKKSQLSILSVPICTLLSSGDDYITLLDQYDRQGLTEVLGGLTTLFNTPVNKYLVIPQRGLEKMSARLGEINVLGRDTTLLNVFEGTYVDSPVDLQIEIRSLAASVITPSVLAHLPDLMMIAVREFKTNVRFIDLFGIYRCVLVGGPGIIKKSLLPGTYSLIGPKKVWLVQPVL